jgi:hypothetical protein
MTMREETNGGMELRIQAKRQVANGSLPLGADDPERRGKRQETLAQWEVV